MFEFIEHDYDCTTEVEIRFADETLGFVGGSRSIDTVREVAEKVCNDALTEFFAPVLEKIKANREVGPSFLDGWDD